MFEEIDKLIAEVNALRPLPPEQEARVSQKLRMNWNFHSNALEGNSLSFGETAAFLMHGLTAKGKPFKDYLDIRGHDEVIGLLVDVVNRREEITPHLIRGLHKVLLVEDHEVRSTDADGTPRVRLIVAGKYKSTPNHLVTATGATKFFVSPAETPFAMEELLASCERDLLAGKHPIEVATEAHHRFTQIHPFDDGNGRMARILMNLLLMRTKYLPAIIKTSEKSEYLFALSQADADDLSGLRSVVIKGISDSAHLYLRAARGESIDELSDFDRRLALLSQSVRTQQPEGLLERTIESQLQKVQQLVVPILAAVGDRLRGLDSLFAKVEHWVSGHEAGQVFISRVGSYVSDISNRNLGFQLSEIQLFYHGTGFSGDAAKDFLCSLKFYFQSTQILVQLQLTGSGGEEVFRVGYSEALSRMEVDEVVAKILERVVFAAERFVE